MLAIFSRFVILALFVFWRILARPYDTSAGLTRPCLSPNQNDHQVNVKWKTVGSVIENGVVWDSVYYVQIAQCGYEYEQTHAFLPVLPLTMRFLANTVLSRLVPRVGYRATLAIAGYLISNVAFVYAALYLYKLTLYVVEDERQAWRATALFCFNPASVFYSSMYPLR
jgi:phosphatidylinositol glycan class V